MTSGILSLISLGPGDLRQMTPAAQAALQRSDLVIGYQVYLDLVQPLLNPAQKQLASPIGHELKRAGQAIDLAASGHYVAVVSSGDIGIYAMASPIFEQLRRRGGVEPAIEVEVYPGVSAIQAAAARLGAPLGHDFCTISLSDLLTPWPGHRAPAAGRSLGRFRHRLLQSTQPEARLAVTGGYRDSAGLPLPNYAGRHCPQRHPAHRADHLDDAGRVGPNSGRYVYPGPGWQQPEFFERRVDGHAAWLCK